MPTWLLFIHSSNHKDHKFAYKYLETTIKNTASNPACQVYVTWFGPTRFSTAYLLHIQNGNVTVLSSHDTKDASSHVIVLDRFTTLIPVKIDAFCGSFHGSGWCIGPWKHTKTCFMTTKDLIRVTITKLKIPLVCFDSCYMGNLSCLYELPPCVKYTVASPAFHPYQSMTELFTFCELDPANPKSFALCLARDWMKWAWPKAKYSCLMVFDMKHIAPLVSALKIHWDALHFGQHSRIDKEDANLSDLWSAAENAPIVRQLIKRCVVHDDYLGVSKRVFGPSVECRLPRKWQGLFMETRFYKDVLVFHWSLYPPK